jgi:hypothetical protein
VTWFRRLTGFEEVNYEAVKERIHIDGEWMISSANGRRFKHGKLDIASVGELEATASRYINEPSPTRVSEIIGNIQDIHCNPNNAGSLFQAASQFNLLEMVSPTRAPEDGVGDYEHDHTQGPACAIACGAGTIYRNYFVPIGSQIGQTRTNQINCLKSLESELSNLKQPIWNITNGYAFARESALIEISNYLESITASRVDELEKALRVGVQWDTQVTASEHKHLVTQVYCSAMPLGYSTVAQNAWKALAKLVLRATYRATLAAAVINAAKTGNRNIYLTKVGGGVFGNPQDWIDDAILKALHRHKNSGLNCQIVSYRESNSANHALIAKFNELPQRPLR